jgi:hypothetical protein
LVVSARARRCRTVPPWPPPECTGPHPAYPGHRSGTARPFRTGRSGVRWNGPRGRNSTERPGFASLFRFLPPGPATGSGSNRSDPAPGVVGNGLVALSRNTRGATRSALPVALPSTRSGPFRPPVALPAPGPDGPGRMCQPFCTGRSVDRWNGPRAGRGLFRTSRGRQQSGTAGLPLSRSASFRPVRPSGRKRRAPGGGGSGLVAAGGHYHAGVTRSAAVNPVTLPLTR